MSGIASILWRDSFSTVEVDISILGDNISAGGR